MSRLPLLNKDEVPTEYHDIFGVGMNLHRQTLHSPKLARLSRQMGLYFRRESPLAPRLCELAILQVAWLARSPYEYSHHLKIALGAGVSGDELSRLSRGEPLPDGQGECVRRAVTDIVEDGEVSEASFAALSAVLENDQIVDLIFLASFYVGFTRFTASLKLQVEPDYEPFLNAYPLPD